MIGGILGFFGVLGVEKRKEKKSFQYGFKLMCDEIATIERRVREYTAKPPDEGIRINAALPTLAWRLLLNSGHLFRLGALPAIVAFYGAVEEANFLTSQAFSALETAKLAEREEDRALFLSKAIQLSGEPYKPLADEAAALLKRLMS
jgi:hypothetical protein